MQRREAEALHQRVQHEQRSRGRSKLMMEEQKEGLCR